MRKKEISGVSHSLDITKSYVDLVVLRTFDVDHVPLDLIETVKQYQQRLLNQGLSQEVHLKEAAVNRCTIQIGNITLDPGSLSGEELLRRLNVPLLHLPGNPILLVN